jgi:hypothetical protein
LTIRDFMKFIFDTFNLVVYWYIRIHLSILRGDQLQEINVNA